jgi:hypothetical protein
MLLASLVLLSTMLVSPALAQTDPLPSWNDGEVKQAIVKFVQSVTDRSSAQMLQWTAAGDGARFMGLVRHTDAQREWDYDRQSPIGRLDRALDEATAKNWTVVDMKRDWKKIYPFG